MVEKFQNMVKGTRISMHTYMHGITAEKNVKCMHD